MLRNKYDKETLKKKLEMESEPRVVFSFYRYVTIEEPSLFRNTLYSALERILVLGRIYVAREGINAQISLPISKQDDLRKYLDSHEVLKGIVLNSAIENKKESFLKLVIKVKNKIVADGLPEDSYLTSNVGKHLTPLEFHQALEDPNTLVIDFRNNYESEIGHFENAICPDAETFREELPLVEEILKQEPKDKKLLLYCTGGIRCEKASAYLRHKGFTDVNQLQGGIIAYTKAIQEKNLKSKFIGKNFVFDDRLGERVTEDVLTVCYQCGKSCDSHTNCANLGCHVLFIQCKDCSEMYSGCCSQECKEIVSLDPLQQKAFRKQNSKHKYPTHHLTIKHMERLKK